MKMRAHPADKAVKKQLHLSPLPSVREKHSLQQKAGKFQQELHKVHKNCTDCTNCTQNDQITQTAQCTHQIYRRPKLQKMHTSRTAHIKYTELYSFLVVNIFDPPFLHIVFFIPSGRVVYQLFGVQNLKSSHFY